MDCRWDSSSCTRLPEGLLLSQPKQGGFDLASRAYHDTSLHMPYIPRANLTPHKVVSRRRQDPVINLERQKQYTVAQLLMARRRGGHSLSQALRRLEYAFEISGLWVRVPDVVTTEFLHRPRAVGYLISRPDLILDPFSPTPVSILRDEHVAPYMYWKPSAFGMHGAGYCEVSLDMCEMARIVCICGNVSRYWVSPRRPR